MKKISLLFTLLLLVANSFAQKTIVQYLSGTEKDHTVLWDFYCSEGRKAAAGPKYRYPRNGKHTALVTITMAMIK